MLFCPGGSRSKGFSSELATLSGKCWVLAVGAIGLKDIKAIKAKTNVRLTDLLVFIAFFSFLSFVQKTPHPVSYVRRWRGYSPETECYVEALGLLSLL
jgi:hypothetical protein